MMMSSTSMTSTSGVTLISCLTPPLAPPRSIAMGNSPCSYADRPGAPGFRLRAEKPDAAEAWSLKPKSLRRLLDEVVDELRRRVVHFDVEVLDAAGQVIVEPHRRNCHDEAER